MSNRIVYDPLLVRYLSEELDGALRGRACAAAPFFAPDLSVVLPVQGGEALRLDLHPTRGWARLVGHAAATGPFESRCAAVEAPEDERALVVRLEAPDRFGASARRLVIELHTNQWNAVLVSEEDQRILGVLRSRTAGGRSLRPGDPYLPPAGELRYGGAEVDEPEAREVWRARLGTVEPGSRRGAVLREFAYTGTPNVGAILGEATESTGDEVLMAAFRRWWWLRSLPPARPAMLRLDSGPLPYPIPLPGVVTMEPIPSLLAGMARVAGSGDEPGAPAVPRPDAGLIAAAARRADAIDRRIARLQEELAAAGDAARLRGLGDLLLAKLHELPRGADRVELEGWQGETEVIELDASISPADNAARLYDEARKRERAGARLPKLIRAARAEAERWREVANAPPDSAVPGWAREALERGGTGPADGEGETVSHPYRVYRTSGGLEVRVGRSARANDRLTFGHSSPNDVWLHARSVPGSHVILRWPSPDAAPPARDLQEAAVLAARYSRARTSAVVAVDWTRRKHVRKPRGAPPGSVVIQRAKTVFVEPDAAVEERMRVD